jgi:predicted outer membrane repeat protein
VKGGAIMMRDTRGTSFRNVTFARNHAGSGGAISMDRNQNTTFVDVTFIDNEAAGDAGAIELSRNNANVEFRRCKFLHNFADGSNSDENPGRGGSVFLDTSNEDILVVDCLFEYNIAIRGASLCANDRNVRVSFVRTVFQHNVAELHSGGVYSIYDNADMTFSNSTFFNNSASDGPAVRQHEFPSFVFSELLCLQ